MWREVFLMPRLLRYFVSFRLSTLPCKNWRPNLCHSFLFVAGYRCWFCFHSLPQAHPSGSNFWWGLLFMKVDQWMTAGINITSTHFHKHIHLLATSGEDSFLWKKTDEYQLNNEKCFMALLSNRFEVVYQILLLLTIETVQHGNDLSSKPDGGIQWLRVKPRVVPGHGDLDIYIVGFHRRVKVPSIRSILYSTTWWV